MLFPGEHRVASRPSSRPRGLVTFGYAGARVGRVRGSGSRRSPACSASSRGPRPVAAPAESYEALAKDLYKRRVDVAWMPPLGWIALNQKKRATARHPRARRPRVSRRHRRAQGLAHPHAARPEEQARRVGRRAQRERLRPPAHPARRARRRPARGVRRREVPRVARGRGARGRRGARRLRRDVRAARSLRRAGRRRVERGAGRRSGAARARRVRARPGRRDRGARPTSPRRRARR